MALEVELQVVVGEGAWIFIPDDKVPGEGNPDSDGKRGEEI